MGLGRTHSSNFYSNGLLTGVFIEKVDAVGHYNGSESNKLKEAVKEIDSWLVRLLDALSGTPNVNLMVFSDHGMTERLGGAADARSGLINVLDYINSSDWAHAAGSKAAPGLQIWPKPDNEDWVRCFVFRQIMFMPARRYE